MTIDREYVVKYLVASLLLLATVGLVSFIPQNAVAQSSGSESDFIDRGLPNPTGEAILNWAPICPCSV